MKFKITDNRFHYKTGTPSEIERSLKRTEANVVAADIRSVSMEDVLSKLYEHLHAIYRVERKEIAVSAYEIARQKAYITLKLENSGYRKVFTELVHRQASAARKRYLARLKRIKAKNAEANKARALKSSTGFAASDVIVYCYRSSSDRIRVRPLQGQGLDSNYNVSFPRDLRILGARYRVERITLGPTKKSYVASGVIKKIK